MRKYRDGVRGEESKVYSRGFEQMFINPVIFRLVDLSDVQETFKTKRWAVRQDPCITNK